MTFTPTSLITPDTLSAVVSAVEFLTELHEAGVPAEIRDRARAVAARLTSAALPPPPNGVAWTPADLAALKAQHDALLDDISLRHAPGADGEP